jgi:hypothetical protein
LRFFCAKDSLKYFHWEIKEDTKIILGYSCQLAVTTLEEGPMIGFSLLPDAGPWKFINTGYDFGIKSIDDYVSWEALEYVLKISDFKIPENPFQVDTILGLSLRRYTNKSHSSQ